MTAAPPLTNRKTPRRRTGNTEAGHEGMSWMAHLGELRRRLIICIAAIVAGTTGAFFLWDLVLEIATDPYCQAQAARSIDAIADGSPCQLYISSPMALFTTRLSISAYLGLFFALPVVLWQLWRFVTPGLNRNEKRYAIPFVASSVVLFTAGAAVAWLTFPRAIAFFLAIGGENIVTLFDPAPYLRLIFVMMLVFGLAFEIPLLLVFLQLARVLSSQQLRNWRRQAIVINFIIAAVGSPTQDPYSLAFLAIPMCILYEVAIVVGRLCKR